MAAPNYFANLIIDSKETYTNKFDSQAINNINRPNYIQADMSRLIDNTQREYYPSAVPNITPLIDNTPVSESSIPFDNPTQVIDTTPNYDNPTFNTLIAENPNTQQKFKVEEVSVELANKGINREGQQDLTTKSFEEFPSAVPQGRKLSNWFTRLLEQKGQDYISSGQLSVNEVISNAERIINDMVSGRIDYDNVAQYIIKPIIIDTLISYCSNKLAILMANKTTLSYFQGDYANKDFIRMNDPNRYGYLNSIDNNLARNISQAISINEDDVRLYSTVLNRLNAVRDTNNVSSLFSLPNECMTYRRTVKKRY